VENTHRNGPQTLLDAIESNLKAHS